MIFFKDHTAGPAKHCFGCLSKRDFYHFQIVLYKCLIPRLGSFSVTFCPKSWSSIGLSRWTLPWFLTLHTGREEQIPLPIWQPSGYDQLILTRNTFSSPFPITCTLNRDLHLKSLYFPLLFVVLVKQFHLFLDERDLRSMLCSWLNPSLTKRHKEDPGAWLCSTRLNPSTSDFCQ